MGLTVFNACTKDELKENDYGSKEQTIKKASVYFENDYLVFKNIETLDSLKKVLSSNGINSQIFREQNKNFISAFDYRSMANDQLMKFTSEDQANHFIQKLINKEYFNSEDSCLTYPFNMISWESILNPQGIVKIGSVLYCFQKDKQICIMDGKKETLESYLKGEVKSDEKNIRVITFASAFQFIRGNNFGQSLNEVVARSGKRKSTISLIYDAVYMPNDNVYVNHAYYEFYFHQQKKSVAWWNDDRTYFHWYPASLQFGGTNLDGAP